MSSGKLKRKTVLSTETDYQLQAKSRLYDLDLYDLYDNPNPGLYDDIHINGKNAFYKDMKKGNNLRELKVFR